MGTIIYYESGNSSDVLYHHGIKGQKWGVRRFQNKDGTYTSRGKARRNNPSLVGMTIQDEQLLAEAGIFVAMFGTQLVANKLAEQILRKILIKNLEKRKNNRSISNLENCPKLKKPMSASDNAKVTNPGFPTMGRVMNCAICTTAMAMREKGYDVIAGKSTIGWNGNDLFARTFNSPTHKMSPKEGKNVLDTLLANGDKAYGNLGVTWKVGGGHSVFWKNENGTTHIYDGQDGTEITRTNESRDKFIKLINPRTIIYNRLDNCEPTEYALGLVESRRE